MPEPTTSAALTIAASAAAVPVLTVAGVSLGLRADVLLAGFAGSIAVMGLLNSVPRSGDTWRELLNTSLRRIGVAVCSSLVAGYATPLALLWNGVPDALALSMAFVVGAGAQRYLARAMEAMRAGPPGTPTPPPGGPAQ